MLTHSFHKEDAASVVDDDNDQREVTKSLQVKVFILLIYVNIKYKSLCVKIQVLMRDRKRHTARRVASTRSAVLSGWQHSDEIKISCVFPVIFLCSKLFPCAFWGSKHNIYSIYSTEITTNIIF